MPMPLSFSRQQPFLASTGRGSERPFHQRGGRRYSSGLPVSQDSGTGQHYLYATLDPLDISPQVVLPPLLTRNVGALSPVLRCLEMKRDGCAIFWKHSPFQSPLPKDSPLHDGECGSIWWSLLRDADLVFENVFDFRLGTPYTNSGHCRLAFLQHLGYSPRLWQRSKCW